MDRFPSAHPQMSFSPLTTSLLILTDTTNGMGGVSVRRVCCLIPEVDPPRPYPTPHLGLLKSRSMLFSWGLTRSVGVYGGA